MMNAPYAHPHDNAALLSRVFHDALHTRNPVCETILKKADVIVVLGSQSHAVCALLARRAATLFKQGYAPHIIVTGGVINNAGLLEAAYIHRALRSYGVPARAILRDNASTNTRENVINARAIARKHASIPRHPRVIAVGQSFASRRVLMTFAQNWPEALPMVTGVSAVTVPRHEWPTHPRMVQLLAGEVRKMDIYTARGHVRDICVHRLNTAIRRAPKRIKPKF